MQKNRLIIVPTPVGNLEDITFRAIDVLKEADLILAEDTRQSAKLCKHFDIGTPMISHHKFNEHKSLGTIIERLKLGQTIAVISDAGTPGISDPGFLIVRECIREGIEVECLPGATALIPAVVTSGLPMDKFAFEGFLPQKKGRHTQLTKLSEEERTMVFYESPFRLAKTLSQMFEYWGERDAAVCREISKIYEECKRGKLHELANYYTENAPKGEIVIVVEGKRC